MDGVKSSVHGVLCPCSCSSPFQNAGLINSRSMAAKLRCKQRLFQRQLESSPVFYSRRLTAGGGAWRAWEHGDCYTWLEALSLQGFPIQAHLIYSVENK